LDIYAEQKLVVCLLLVAEPAEPSKRQWRIENIQWAFI